MPIPKVSPDSPTVKQWITRVAQDGKILRKNGGSTPDERSHERRKVIRFLGDSRVRSALRDQATIQGNAGLLAFIGAWELRDKDPGRAAKLLREAGLGAPAPSPDPASVGPMRKSLAVPKSAAAAPVARRSAEVPSEPEPSSPSAPVSTKKDYLTTGGGCDDEDLGHS
jgi:hypothetical protein